MEVNMENTVETNVSEVVEETTNTVNLWYDGCG